MPREPETLLNHPDVVKAIRLELMDAGQRGENLIEGIADVQLAAWAWTNGNLPKTLPAMIALVRAIARNIGIAKLRKHIARGKTNVGSTADADEHAALDPPPNAEEPIDMRAVLKDFRESFDTGELGSEDHAILDALADGLDQRQIAAALGMSHAAVRKRVSRMRGLFGGMLARRFGEGPAGVRITVLVAGIAVVTCILFLLPKPTDHPVAKADAGVDSGRPVPEPEVLVDTHAKERTDEAKKLLDEAASLERERKWQECATRADRAIKLDAGTPEGGWGVDAGALRDRCMTIYLRTLDSKGGIEESPRKKPAPKTP